MYTIGLLGDDALLPCLREAGYRLAVGGEKEMEGADLLLLELGRGGEEPAALLHRLSETTRAPILAVVDHASPAVVAAMLDAGADDCIAGPPDRSELLARVRRCLRRGPRSPADALSCRDVVLYPASRQVVVGTQPVALTTREFDLLEFFMRHPGIALTRNQLLNAVWGFDFYGPPKIVDVYVRYLRGKLDERFGAAYIATVRGVGYMFVK